MALENSEATAQSQRPQADAFLNVQVVGPDGELYSLSRGIPLNRNGSKLERSLINAQEADPDKEFTLKGKVRVVAEDDGEDLAL